MALYQPKSFDLQPFQTNSQPFYIFNNYQQQKLTFYDTEYPEQLHLIESIDTYENEIDDYLMLENNIQIEQIKIKKPRKKRRREIHHDKHRKRAQQKKNLNKHVPIPFDYAEDKKILLLVLEIGPKFYKIAKNFPGRTLSMVKNRYYKTLRFQWDVVLGQEYSYMNCLCVKQEEQQNDFSLDSNDQFQGNFQCQSQYYLPSEF